MKKIAIVLFLLASLSCFAQTDNTFYAKAFSGSTVGAKIAAAQLACDANTSIKCIIVIDPSLASLSQGTDPAPCAQCTWVDYRKAAPFGNGVSGTNISPSFINNTCMADQQAGADEGAKIAACNAALAPYGGIIDATGFQGKQYASTGFTLGPGLPTTVNPPSYSVTLKLGYVTLIAGGEIKMSPFSSLIGQGSSIFG